MPVFVDVQHRSLGDEDRVDEARSVPVATRAGAWELVREAEAIYGRQFVRPWTFPWRALYTLADETRRVTGHHPARQRRVHPAVMNPITVTKHGHTRFWAVRDGAGDLIWVCV